MLRLVDIASTRSGVDCEPEATGRRVHGSIGDVAGAWMETGLDK